MAKGLTIMAAMLMLGGSANARCVFHPDQAYMNCTGDGRGAPGPDRGTPIERPVGTNARGFYTPLRTPDVFRSEVTIRYERR
jgi:hypothetical protein